MECARGGGVISADDFHAYEPRWYEPVRGTYRGMEVVASAPPDDGGAQLIDALALLEARDVAAMGPATESADTLELLADVHNQVYYAPARAGRNAASGMVDRPGSGPVPSPGTIHVTVVDEQRNVASLTHSHMASPWVNGLFAEGTQLSGGGSFFQRGMPALGERATVYLAPNMVLAHGRPVLASGSPSVSLVACVLQSLVHVIDFGLPIEEVVAMPRFGARPHEPEHGWLPGVTLEHGFPAAVDAEFRRRWTARGGWLADLGPWHSLTGNFDGVTIDPGSGVLRACADPRRNGAAEAF